MRVIRITLKDGEGRLITESKKKDTSLVFLSEKGKTDTGGRKEASQR